MTDQKYREARIEVATELRRLNNALVGHRPTADVLHAIRSAVDQFIEKVESSPKRANPLKFLTEPDVQDALAAGDVSTLLRRAKTTSMFEDSIVSGPANPMSLAAEYEKDGEGVLTRVTLGPAFEGAPGRAHGGIIAALFDETMGTVLPLAGTLAFTGTLTIAYRAPAPLEQELLIRARITSKQGRKINIEATGHAQDMLFAEAQAVFIAVADMNPTPLEPGPATGD